MNIKYLTIFILIIFSNFSEAQSKKAFTQEAVKAYAEQNYHGALVYFEEALKFDKNDVDILYKTAESARQYNAYGYAAAKYLYLIDTLKNETYPDATYRLGEMYHKLGEYEKSLIYYNLYLSEYSNQNPELTGKARKNIAAVNKAKTLINSKDESVTVTLMDNDINSPDADFAASDANGKIYFSTLKYEAKSKALRYKQIAKTLTRSNGQNKSQIIPGYINDRDQSVAHFAFNNEQTKVYYSICDYVNGWSQACQIFSSEVDKQGNFYNEMKLPSPINLENSSNTQPSVGKTVSGKDILFFVSDRTGGQGGRDIYSVTFEGNNFDDVKPIGNVNTKDDEISPFYHQGTKTLYWSTEGREGFGGFDIFKLPYGSNFPELLPAPYNTSMNDMFYYMDESGTKGYLTSNRSGSAIQYDSYEACCMDIYSYEIDYDIKLDVLTLLAKELTALNSTRICLLDADTGEEISCIDNPKDLNTQSFLLKPNRNYKIVATKDGYSTASETFKTLTSDRILKKELILAPEKIRLEVFTFEQLTKNALPGTTVTLRDLTDGSVQKIVVTNDLSNDFTFDVKTGRTFQLEAEKYGFVTTLDTVSTIGVVGTVRKDLYLPKATLQELLPISLYFDNDYPNPRSKLPTTSSRFVNLANEYILRKDDYVQNYTAPLKGEQKQQATEEIMSFFTNDVQQGKDKFVAFLNQLEQRLVMGEIIELEVRGFASPRSKSDYNKILSERRINSIINELKTFNGGFVSKYLANGALKLKDVSFGDKTAKPNVIGDLNDERNSIYNLNAARERRVEIIKVNYK